MGQQDRTPQDFTEDDYRAALGELFEFIWDQLDSDPAPADCYFANPTSQRLARSLRLIPPARGAR